MLDHHRQRYHPLAPFVEVEKTQGSGALKLQSRVGIAGCFHSEAEAGTVRCGDGVPYHFDPCPKVQISARRFSAENDS